MSLILGRGSVLLLFSFGSRPFGFESGRSLNNAMRTVVLPLIPSPSHPNNDHQSHRL
jgi:hypothetical protein